VTPRGFALKFYTEEGNFDLVGNDTPTFFVRDAFKFEDFIHLQKRMPDTGLRSTDMQWDFWDPVSGDRPPGHDPDVRSRYSAHVPEHEWLLEPYVARAAPTHHCSTSSR
jgi:hypothetical protein